VPFGFIEFIVGVLHMDTASFRENIKNFYNQEAERRNSRSIKADWKIKVRENFYNFMKQENKITLLEIGAGAGYDSQFFINNGLSVTAVDISSEMVKSCQEKGIEAYELDFYNLSHLNNKYDCIYAINSLLHVPKSDLPQVLNEINAVLHSNGLFYMGVYGGQDTEGEHIEIEISDTPRFFAFHSKSYLKKVLESHFSIIEFETLDIDTHGNLDTFHSIIMRKP